MSILDAARDGKLKQVKGYVSQGANINRRDDDGCTPLYLASWNNNDNVVGYLLQQHADTEVRAEGLSNSTPLIAAASDGHIKVLKLLLKHGANVNAQDEDGWTALYRAVMNKRQDCVEALLIHHAKPDIEDKKHENTPLHVAARDKDGSRLAKLLLEHKATVDQRNKDGQTPLWIAAKWGNKETVSELLHHGASVDMCDNQGRSPLVVAVAQHHGGVRVLLERAGAHAIVSGNSGDTSRHGAAQLDVTEEVNYLLEKSPKINRRNKTTDTRQSKPNAGAQ